MNIYCRYIIYYATQSEGRQTKGCVRGCDAWGGGIGAK
jgi:hypothetical protein